MADIQVAVINESTVLSDDQVNAAFPAFQIQVHRDFAPAWGIDADLSLVPRGSSSSPGSWWLVILDNSDQAGALGYHDVTSEGLPLGKVFAGSDIQLGEEWTVTASHELLEMLADPEIDLTVFLQPTANSGTLYAYEVCDPCQADSLGYEINGTLVSDFVFPAWFESFRTQGSTQFDQTKAINQPFALAPGGYISIFDVTTGTGWHQISAQGEPCTYQMRPRLGSRRERRRTPRDQWLSTRMRARSGG